ncbi:MAG: hypothetical protein WBN23_13075 [Woeseia sp.]
MRVSVPPLADRRRESRFFSTLAVAMAIIAIGGFAPTYYASGWFSASGSYAAGERLVVLHSALVTAWFGLLLLQATLVRKGFMQLHRSIGFGGILLAVLLVMVGLVSSSLAASRPAAFIETALPTLVFLLVPLIDILLFAVFVGLAYVARRGRKSHKRWIVLATMNLLGAPVARLLPATWLQDIGLLPVFLVVDLLLIALATWDLRSLGRVHPVTLWGGLILIASQPLRLLVAETASWEWLAGWVTRLS